ncbi:MAG: AAA family ATPase [Planctomycetota bacterium]|nr:AAA family ATPase [Planctomycetota bacterium]
MYIPRPDLEASLKRALKSSRHVIIHGESGTGKSWLYKRVFFEQDVHIEIANMANAVRLGSITKECLNNHDRHEAALKTHYDEAKEGSVGGGLIGGKLSHTGHFALGQKEPFEMYLAAIRKRAGKNTACLVLDNLEAILEHRDLITELANMIILVDDERYAQYDIKLVLVGVPSDIRSYFTQLEHLAPVANRLREIPEVDRLSEDEAHALITTGFFDLLNYTYVGPNMKRDFLRSLCWYTNRVPQHLQELCLEIAEVAESRGGTIDEDVRSAGVYEWVRSSMMSQYATIEKNMNSRSTKVGRKNQAIYAIAHCDRDSFLHSHIEAIIRRLFPSSTRGITLNVSQILTELSTSKSPLIRRLPDGPEYRMYDPRIRVTGRAMLKLDPATESIIKVDIRHYH